MITVAVVGSRTFNDYDLLKLKSDKFLSNIPGTIQVCSGGAKGADKLVIDYAKERGFSYKAFLPDYDKYRSRVAPIMCNRLIVVASDYLVAFHDGESKGTLNAISLAEAKGVPIRVVKFK